ncbi:MAG: ATP-binding protein [Peptostreptococcaceae bacterium]
MLDNTLCLNIIIYISAIIDFLVFKFVLDKFNERTKNKLIINVATVLNIMMIFFLNVININPNIKFFIVVNAGFLFYICNYRITIFKGVIINLTYWMIVVAFEFISSNIILLINLNSTVYDLLKNNIYRAESILLSSAFLVLTIPILKSFKENMELKKRESLHILILIISNILSVIIIFTIAKELKIQSYEQKILLLIISSILIISNISLIYLIKGVVKNNIIKMENKLIREKMDMQCQNYLTMRESQMKVRKLYHDINNHILCIKNLYGNNYSANAYIENIKNELKYSESEISTDNMILDIIVNNKKKVCNENNIDISIDINFSKCGFMEMIDVCSIFSNMIDNAIEACTKIDNNKNRFIIIKGTIVNKFFVIKCENSKINKIKLRKNKIITDKVDSFSHGLGISSIKNSVKKYNGEVTIDYSENKFIIQIYIPLK